MPENVLALLVEHVDYSYQRSEECVHLFVLDIVHIQLPALPEAYEPANQKTNSKISTMEFLQLKVFERKLCFIFVIIMNDVEDGI